MAASRGRGGALTRRLRAGTVALTAGVLIALAVLRAVDLWWWRQQILRTGERRATNLALIVSQHLQEMFNVADASLRQLVIHSQRVGGPHASSAAWAPMLAAARAGTGTLGSMSVTDATGTITHSTLPQIVGQTRRDQFIFHRLSTLDHDELAVDTPFQGQNRPRMIVIPVGRRLTTPSGAFDGMVVMTFSPAELRDFFQTIDVGREGVVWVFHPSGSTLFREPSLLDSIGVSAIGNPIFDAAHYGSAGMVRGRVAARGPRLVTAYRNVAVPPLIAAVSLAEHELLEQWRREVVGSVLVLLALGLTLGATLVVLGRQIEARAVAEDALGEMQRLESLARLTGGVAHDFNNLLTAILGYTALMLDELESKHPLRRDLIEVQRAGQSAAALTQQLLAFSRRQVLQPQIIDLNAIVGRIHSMLERLIGEQIQLVTRLGASLDPVSADPGQIEQIVMNLAVNARDAMPDGGKLSIETSNVELDAAYAAQHPDVTTGRHVMLAVTDTGTGIDAETKAHIFEPFFTTKPRGEGTGLGLATVYGIVKQSGGSIWVYSEPGHGTTFKVYLPAVTQPLTAHANGDAHADPLHGTETILVAEDQPEVRAVARAILTRHGYTVLEAVDGEDALRIVRDYAKPIDLLFTDVVMPGMSGRELVDRLRIGNSVIRVLYASGYTDDAIVRHGVLEPGIAFIQKPYTPDSLLRKIRETLKEPVQTAAG